MSAEKTIWKFPLRTTDYQVISLPIGWIPLTVQAQEEKPCLWALVEPKAERLDVMFRIFGTGHRADVDGLDYMGTYQLENGTFVGQVFAERLIP